MIKTKLFAAVLALTLAPAAWAVTITYNGAGTGQLPDNDPTGLDSVISVGDNLLISSLEITLQGLSGTWVGDLNVSLSGPGGSADIMFRTGDAQGDCCGDSSDLAGNYTFSDDGGDWWAAAAAAGGADVIANGDYQATTILGAVVLLDGVFGGSSSLGDWTLTLSDNAGGDDHFLMDGWELRITGEPVNGVPEPGMLVLLGLGLAALGFARRRS